MGTGIWGGNRVCDCEVAVYRELLLPRWVFEAGIGSFLAPDGIDRGVSESKRAGEQ